MRLPLLALEDWVLVADVRHLRALTGPPPLWSQISATGTLEPLTLGLEGMPNPNQEETPNEHKPTLKEKSVFQF